MTHTPGPRSVESLDVFGEDDRWIASIHPEGTGVFRGRDNARLIDAAPDLLEACREALDVLENMTTIQFSYGDDRPARDRLQAAIAKATGQEVPA